MGNQKQKTLREKLANAIIGIIALPFLPLIFLFVIVALLLYFLYRLILLITVWIFWLPNGKNSLVIYSNSTIWKDDFENKILPQLDSNVVVMNWSERRLWRKYSLESMCFRAFSGRYEYNPIAMKFRLFRWVKRVRFFKAYKASKHGDNTLLEARKEELFSMLNV